MKKINLILALLICARMLFAQDSQPATQADADFHNAIKLAFQKAMPINFKDWDFSILQRTLAEVSVGDNIGVCEGKTCFRSEEMIATYDGSMVKFDENIALQKEIQALTPSTPDYQKKMVLATSKLENITRLEITFRVNYDEMSGLEYCKPNGFEKLTPPDGWNSYYVSSAPLTCVLDSDQMEGSTDVSIFSLGVIPTIKENKEEIPVTGQLNFALNKSLMKTYKIQSIVLKITGSRENALQLIKAIDVNEFHKLMGF